MSKETERYGELFKSIQSTKDEQRYMFTEVEDKLSERYGDLFTEVEDESSERYGNIFEKFGKTQTQNFEELSAQMKRGTDTHISIEDCIAYLNAAKARIDELEKVGTYQATQESKSIKSDFAELIEDVLKDKYFVICDFDGKFSAFIFDDRKKRDGVKSTDPQQILIRTDFEEFKKQAKLGYRNICNFRSCDDECLIFQI